MPSIAIVTCAQLPDLDSEESLLLAPLRERGATATPAVWDDPRVDWDSFDATVIRSPWDYPKRRDEFVAWAARVPRLHNPAEVVKWNTDKRYMGQLAAAGIPVVPTTWLPVGGGVPLPETGEWVVKPTVGAGSREVGRYRMGELEDREAAEAHVARLHGSGAVAMLQPYVDRVDSQGEKALIYVDGKFSHAVRKSAMLNGPYRGDVELYKEEQITAVEADPTERDLAERTLDALPGDSAPLYARVDLVSGDSGLLVLEVELTEPSLFYRHAPGSADRLAEAIMRRL